MWPILWTFSCILLDNQPWILLDRKPTKVARKKMISNLYFPPEQHLRNHLKLLGNYWRWPLHLHILQVVIKIILWCETNLLKKNLSVTSKLCTAHIFLEHHFITFSGLRMLFRCSSDVLLYFYILIYFYTYFSWRSITWVEDIV